MEGTHRPRIESIDLLRGSVIILMALDHVRMYLAEGGWYADPANLDTTTPQLFMTRWITHFCAPVFIFLAGTSAALYGARHHGIRPVSRYLLTRGLWLILCELVIVNFGWTFDITFSFHLLQVIWAIGASMVVLGLLVYLPRWAIFTFGISLVFGHNLLDPIHMEGTSLPALIWYILHQDQVVALTPELAVHFHYPLLPLVGLMALGYVFGTLYRPDFGAERRKQWLLWLGSVIILLFLILRGLNLYGEPSPWSPQPTMVYTILSFLNTTKYPASLQFVLMTMGPALLFLALTEAVKNRVSDRVVLLGRVSLFFYIVHAYVIHSIALLAFVLAGRSWTEYIITGEAYLSNTPSDFGVPLYVIYLMAALVVVGMYPLCRWYRGYKKGHPQYRVLEYI